MCFMSGKDWWVREVEVGGDKWKMEALLEDLEIVYDFKWLVSGLKP